MDASNVSTIIDVIDIATAVLIALRPFSPRDSLAGSIGAIVTFLLTNSFLLSTPGTIDHSHVIPFLAGPGGFIIKDLPMLGCALWIAGEALTGTGLAE
ncbi:MAG TPA: DUF417 family protein [Candidatus Limnocylindrales bacterium]|nr:DUF417 family protein [Candidatus Limnocylindrales bacterium]